MDVTFTASTGGAINWTWDFGDGETASGTLTPIHVYEDDGVFVATLTVTDAAGASDSDNLLVTVKNVEM